MRSLLFVLLPALLLLVSSCTGIPRGWAEARRTTANDPVSGAWTGTWKSDANGHSGGLRAVATKVREDVWEFRYRASWAKILCAGFSCEAGVKLDGKGGAVFNGSKDLGKLFGGVFTHYGTVRDNHFHASYMAHMDRGVMEMKRVRE